MSGMEKLNRGLLMDVYRSLQSKGQIYGRFAQKLQLPLRYEARYIDPFWIFYQQQQQQLQQQKQQKLQQKQQQQQQQQEQQHEAKQPDQPEQQEQQEQKHEAKQEQQQEQQEAQQPQQLQLHQPQLQPQQKRRHLRIQLLQWQQPKSLLTEGSSAESILHSRQLITPSFTKHTIQAVAKSAAKENDLTLMFLAHRQLSNRLHALSQIPTSTTNSQTTHDIAVNIQSFFWVRTYDNPFNTANMFRYRVRISNLSKDTTYVLTERKWKFFAENQDEKQIRGEGVVGLCPILRPGSVFQYWSFSSFPTELGKLSGFFRFLTRDQKRSVIAEIPPVLFSTFTSPNFFDMYDEDDPDLLPRFIKTGNVEKKENSLLTNK